MRSVILAAVPAMFAAAMPVAAKADTPGPFSCIMGDSSVILTSNDDGSAFTGTPENSGENTGEGDSEQEDVLTLAQKYPGWRTIYEGGDRTMVMESDGAVYLHGKHGIGSCFASRSIPPLPYLPGPWSRQSLGTESWMEAPTSGTVITWGGNVRAGPGTDFGRVAGVPLGVSVTLVAQADRVWLQEYAWFKVRLPDGREGYIAGGLLCSRDARQGFYNARSCEG
ncbi:SH3 domain-containing protein [Altererythrobacter sp.]|nr:SH3 domain-containing protein [Altererythrobacter sp.]